MTPEARNKLVGRAMLVLLGLQLAAYLAATFLR